ncbi:xanthine dehydrogenase accessory protein XdhC [Motiliproteus sp. MSK22-1]|nr:xanthine dehydrogenase accessory protein XdhC [Motiliproteus sp. MSK22-1]
MSTSNWIQALSELDQQDTPAVLVTIVEQRGSTPRNNGSKMVVTEDSCFDTIGGGHLEYKATKIARQMLTDNDQQSRMESFSLGASLGQCCGGAHTLLFEPVGGARLNIAVFGAGHIGRALIPILASLPCNLRWIDSREQEFPEQIPNGVKKIVNEYPVDEIDDMPEGSYFIVMTHNHQLDLELTEKILKRGDFSHYGLIGSTTKRKKFEHRLKAKGFSPDTIDRMVCPMGVAAVKGKLPAEIAISIAAEIVSLYNCDFGKKTTTHQKDKQTKAPKVSRLAC